MGIGVALSLVPVLIWEGLLILLAGALSPFLSTEVITEMSAWAVRYSSEWDLT